MSPSGIHQDSFSQLPLGRSDRVISELSDAFSSQSKRQPWREENGHYERKAEREAGERGPGGPAISKKSCLKPSDVVRCLSTEQRLPDLRSPEESRPSKPLGSPFPGREAGQTELRRGGKQAGRRAAQSGVSQVGLQHDRVCPWHLTWPGGLDGSAAVPLPRPSRCLRDPFACLGSEEMAPDGVAGASVKV